MSNKAKKPKTNITKITAKSQPKSEPTTPAAKTSNKPKAAENIDRKQKGKKNKKDKATAEKPLKEVFILARPFAALGRYLRDSWREIRQVRWPNRKATWKMTLAVLIYCAIFMAFILILDTFFTFIFNLALGTN